MCVTATNASDFIRHDLFPTINDGINKVSEVALAMFELLYQLGTKVAFSLLHAIKVCRVVTGVTSFISLGRYVFLFLTKDTKGQRYWETGITWQSVASTISTIVSKTAYAAIFVHDFKILSFGKAIAPIGIAGNIFGIFSSIFDIGDQLKAIKLAKKTCTQRTTDCKKWNAYLEKLKKQPTVVTTAFSQHASALKAQHQNSQERVTESTEKLAAQLKQYELLSKAPVESLKAFCCQKVARLRAKIDLARNSQKVAYLTIIFDVAFIALSIALLAVPLLSSLPWIASLALGVAAFALLTNTLDLSSHGANTALKYKKLPSLRQEWVQLATT